MMQEVKNLCFDTVVKDKEGIFKKARIKIPKANIDTGTINIYKDKYQTTKEIPVTVSG